MKKSFAIEKNLFAIDKSIRYWKTCNIKNFFAIDKRLWASQCCIMKRNMKKLCGTKKQTLRYQKTSDIAENLCYIVNIVT